MADQRDFDRIVTPRVRQRLLDHCRGYCGPDAEDAVQEGLLIGYARFGRFDATKDVLPWLRAITVRRYISYRRTSAFIVSESCLPLYIDETGLLDCQAIDPEVQMFGTEGHNAHMETIMDAVEQLTPTYRQAILDYLAGRDQRDEPTEQRLKRARHYLREIINAKPGPDNI